MSLNTTNWNYCHYSTGPLKSMISHGLPYNATSLKDPLYWVTVLKSDHQEVFQEEFQDLPNALQCINERYGHWSFVDTSQASSGCDSCSNK